MLTFSIDAAQLESLIVQTVTKTLEEQFGKRKKTESEPKDELEFITKKKAAEIAAVSVSTIDNWRRAGYIKPYYFGSSCRYKRVDILAYLESKCYSGYSDQF